MEIGLILGLPFFLLILFWLIALPLFESIFPNEDSRLKPIEKWEEENITNKERVAKWREEQKKSD
tara:strand:- start:218 stop:412 length:195 start_codon:yes stop_codon:yes gene_type:complete